MDGRKFVENIGLKTPALYHESDTVEEIFVSQNYLRNLS